MVSSPRQLLNEPFGEALCHAPSGVAITHDVDQMHLIQPNRNSVSICRRLKFGVDDEGSRKMVGPYIERDFDRAPEATPQFALLATRSLQVAR